MNPAIVIVAFDRPHSLSRLLHSLKHAYFSEKDSDANIPLVISIDQGGDKTVFDIAESFEWKYGEKRIINHGQRMGLKNHILSCGELVNEFGSIIMLEDDLFLSPTFYDFAAKALEFTSKDPRIGGISLYAHKFNVFARLPFEPIDDGYDNWYFQFASSWGQAWTANQWNGFAEWQNEHDGEDLSGNGLPNDIAAWKESSWLKYAIKYLIETDKYFLYPRISYTTNFADAGTHSARALSELQIPLSHGAFNHPERINSGRPLYFSSLDDSGSVYDAYFENSLLPYEMDLYGIKSRDLLLAQGIESQKPGSKLPHGSKLVSSASLPFEIVREYGLSLKPIDQNVAFKLRGQGLRLYDLNRKAPIKRTKEGAFYSFFYPGLNQSKISAIVKDKISDKFNILK